MNLTDAVELGQKIGKTWRGGPHPEIWAEELEELHTNQARAAYERLRKSEDTAPSIAKFKVVYDSLTEREDDRRKPRCLRCDGGGWVEEDPVQHHRQCERDDRCHCAAVKPCLCPEGQARQASFTRIVGQRKDVA